MQIKNNDDVPWLRYGDSGQGVFNGDIGILKKIDSIFDRKFVKILTVFAKFTHF